MLKRECEEVISVVLRNKERDKERSLNSIRILQMLKVI